MTARRVVTAPVDCSVAMNKPRGRKLGLLLIADQFLIRRGLRQVLSQEYPNIIFGEAEGARQAVAESRKHSWDLIIFDGDFPDSSSFSVLKQIRANQPAARILALLSRSDGLSAQQLMEMGISGYLSKKTRAPKLVKAVNQVLAGKRYFDSSISRTWSPEEPAPHKTLSNREFKVMLATARGSRVSDIAAELRLSIKTVSTYKRRVLNKLHLSSTADLVRYALEHDLPDKGSAPRFENA